MQAPFDIAADLDTPVSAYLKLRELKPRFLLESVEGGERLARYSFLGFGDALEVRMDDKAMTIAGERRARNYTRPMTRPGELAAAWRAAGLRDVRETVLSIRMEFSSFADYWTPYVGRDGPGAEYVGSLGTAERERLEAAVRAAYLDGEPDGARSYAALAWAVKGTA